MSIPMWVWTFSITTAKAQPKHILQTTGGGVNSDYDGDDWPDLFFPNGRDLDEVNEKSSAFGDRLYRSMAAS